MTAMRRASLSALLLGCLINVGCGRDDLDLIDDPLSHASDYLPQTSISNVFANLNRAYHERTIGEYAKLFDGAAFQFEFAARDRQADPSLPSTVDYLWDIASTKNLFQDETVNRIVLNFTREDAVPATQDDLPDSSEGAWKVTLQNVHLEVHAVNEDGEPLEYLVDRDAADFFLRQYPEERVNGDPVWKIFHWRDRPAGGALATRKTTWGQIKARFH